MGCNIPRYLCPYTSGPCCQGGRSGCKPSRAAKDRKVFPPQCASHHFVPFVIETSGVFGPEALSLPEDIGRQIRAETGEPQSLQFLIQGVSVAIQ